jgi:hypothetical protein
MIRAPSITLCVALLAALACRPPVIDDSPQPDDSGDPWTPVDTDDPPDTGETGDTQDTGETGDTGEPWVDPSCDALPEPPFDVRAVDAYSLEDLDFDQDGNLVGNNGQHVYRSRYDGTSEIWVANLGFEAGMRMLPNGDLVICLDTRGSLVLVHPDGSYETLIGDLTYPNGLEIGRDGRIYVTESHGDRVRRVDPETGESLVLTTDEIPSPEGLTFSPDFRTLYINSYSNERRIYKLPMTEDGEPEGPLEVFAENVGSGYLVGMATDICGNVYVIDYTRGQLLRYSSEGEFTGVMLNGHDLGGFAYLPNMKWGSGVGGWSDHKLYMVNANNVRSSFEVDIGVRGKEY